MLFRSPKTGNLTEEQLERLRNARPPSTWAAVAYTARGANGTSFNAPSRAAAEQEAIDKCLRLAGRRAECKPITGSGATCITMASYTNRRGTTTYFGSHVALRRTLAESISEALRLCNDAQNSGGKCAAKVTVCADGSHRSGSGR